MAALGVDEVGPKSSKSTKDNFQSRKVIIGNNSAFVILLSICVHATHMRA